MNRLIATAAAFALMAAAPPIAGTPRTDPIDPNANQVLNWTVSSDRIVYVEDKAGLWYRVSLTAPCDALRSAFGIELQPVPRARFDRASSLVAGYSSCPILSVSRVSVPAIPPLEPFGRSR
jgi:hypothetical protein